jgi:hypothetical protein
MSWDATAYLLNLDKMILIPTLASRKLRFLALFGLLFFRMTFSTLAGWSVALNDPPAKQFQ